MVAAGTYWLGAAGWLAYDFPRKLDAAVLEVAAESAANDAAAEPRKFRTPEETEAFIREVLAHADAPAPPPSREAQLFALRSTVLDAGKFGLIFIAALVAAGVIRWVAEGFGGDDGRGA